MKTKMHEINPFYKTTDPVYQLRDIIITTRIANREIVKMITEHPFDSVYIQYLESIFKINFDHCWAIMEAAETLFNELLEQNDNKYKLKHLRLNNTISEFWDTVYILYELIAKKNTFMSIRNMSIDSESLIREWEEQAGKLNMQILNSGYTSRTNSIESRVLIAGIKTESNSETG